LQALVQVVVVLLLLLHIVLRACAAEPF